MKVALLLLLVSPTIIHCLDNGLAKKPPMGWMSWTRFACNTDCKLYPDECINEKLYKEMADVMESEGYKKAGYEFVSIDDCWSEMTRDKKSKKLVANGKRFPSGIKKLSQYIHSKGLKLGLYSDMGTKTCQGYPGHLTKEDSTDGNYFDIDAQTFADWEVDYLKVDGCYAKTKVFDAGYPMMSKALNKTGRPIVYSCEWPFYQTVYDHMKPDYDSISKYCNQYRNYYDVSDSWERVLQIVDFYVENYALFSKYHGPGYWNDPDMLDIGNFGLSLEQSKAQMALWCMMSAPLFMSNDLRNIRQEEKNILLNKKLIQIDQEGTMAKIVVDEKPTQVWVKKLSEVGHFAVLYLNRDTLGTGKFISYDMDRLLHGFKEDGQPLGKSFKVTDLFDESLEMQSVTRNQNLTLKVNPNGVRIVELSVEH